jgi:AraC family transcriptional regulator of arabinose operon
LEHAKPSKQRQTVQLEEGWQREQIIRCLRDVLNYRDLPGPESVRLAELALEQALTLTSTQSPGSPALDERIETILHHMRRSLAHPWCVEELAERVNLSPSRFAHLFQESLDMPPMRYLEQLRMARAKDLLLTTPDPIKAIAKELGYSDPLHFSTRFRQVIGCSPRHLRRHGVHVP